jgi:hypothetical protein
MFRTASPFSPWGAGDDFMGPTHALDLTAHYMRQQQFQLPRSSPLSGRPLGMDSDITKMQMNDGMNFADGTIRPNMLDCNNTSYDMNDIIYTDGFESTMAMA